MVNVLPSQYGKVVFPGERLNAADALVQLEAATGLDANTLSLRIPELTRTDLSFGLDWASDGFDEDHEVGQFNADAVKGFVVLRIPVLNAAGNRECDVTGINRSYHINVTNGEIRGFSDYYEADKDLSESYSTARLNDEDVASRRLALAMRYRGVSEEIRCMDTREHR